ncbi:MAG: hypothetical protein K8I82_15815, partial [Anaerolineae bacterium]|nr:hypothetical protein [Anaerolineae bacterium]
MKIKTKLTVGASLLMLIPVVVVCAVLGWVAVDNGRQALETKAQNQMIALRNSTQKAIENYFSTVQAQIVTLSDNRMITDALNSLPNAYRLYQSSVEAAGDAGAAKLGAMRQELLAHYNGAFADEYRKQNGGGTFDAGNWLEKLSETGITLQHAYIAANPNPLGEKSKLITPDDGSLYEVMHKRFHESLKDYQERFGYADIFLVDSKTGEVIYSVAKKAEFATSLLEGPFAGTGLGQVFKQANESDDPGFIAMTDFSAYTPSYDNQAAFV